MSRLRAVATLAAAVASLATTLMACAAGGRPYPEACADLGFADRRCAAVVERARRTADLATDDVVSIDLLPREDVGPTLGGSMVARVRFNLVDGGAVNQEVWCGVGLLDDLVCNPNPRIYRYGDVDQDVPCSGEPPECATLPPKPPDAAVAQARPLQIAALDIPLDHLGTYEVEVGRAGLPDGYLTTRSLTLADDQPTSFWIEGGVRLEVRPEDPSRPPVGSRYREGFDGVEPVRVFLVFEVTELEPGAVLQVRDIVVE